jgi:hypothetical protein
MIGGSTSDDRIPSCLIMFVTLFPLLCLRPRDPRDKLPSAARRRAENLIAPLSRGPVPPQTPARFGARAVRLRSPLCDALPSLKTPARYTAFSPFQHGDVTYHLQIRSRFSYKEFYMIWPPFWCSKIYSQGLAWKSWTVSVEP